MVRKEVIRTEEGGSYLREMALATDKPQVSADYAVLRYDYATVPEEHRQVVQDAAVEIHRIHKQAKQDLITIGQRLIAVKNLLSHGQFGQWLATEFDLAERSAQNMMNVAREFGEAQNRHTVALLSDGALYLLAAPSTPQEAREEVEKRIEETGKPPTRKEVKEIIEDHKPPSVRTVNVKPEPSPEPTPPAPRLPAPDPATLPRATLPFAQRLDHQRGRQAPQREVPQAPPPVITRREESSLGAEVGSLAWFDAAYETCERYAKLLGELGEIADRSDTKSKGVMMRLQAIKSDNRDVEWTVKKGEEKSHL